MRKCLKSEKRIQNYIYAIIATVFWGIKTQGENTNIKWL